MNQTEAHAHLAGRVILAIADNDGDQTVALLRDAAEQPGGVLALVISLASVAIESAKLVAGDEWQTVMTDALLGIELSNDQ